MPNLRFAKTMTRPFCQIKISPLYYVTCLHDIMLWHTPPHFGLQMVSFQDLGLRHRFRSEVANHPMHNVPHTETPVGDDSQPGLSHSQHVWPRFHWKGHHLSKVDRYSRVAHSKCSTNTNRGAYTYRHTNTTHTTSYTHTDQCTSHSKATHTFKQGYFY